MNGLLSCVRRGRCWWLSSIIAGLAACESCPPVTSSWYLSRRPGAEETTITVALVHQGARPLELSDFQVFGADEGVIAEAGMKDPTVLLRPGQLHFLYARRLTRCNTPVRLTMQCELRSGKHRTLSVDYEAVPPEPAALELLSACQGGLQP